MKHLTNIFLLLAIVALVSSCSRHKSWECVSIRDDGTTVTQIVPSATRSQIKSLEVDIRSTPNVRSTKCTKKK